jgi:hypothetical protein
MSRQRRRPVVVIAKEVGRLANRILLFAHFIGAALEHDLRIVNAVFGAYAHYFPATASDLLCRFPPGGSVPAFPLGRQALGAACLRYADVLHGLQQRDHDVGLIRLRRDQHLDLNSSAFLDVVRSHRLVLVQDWFFRNGDNCERHGDVIRSFFTPRNLERDRVRRTVEAARAGDPLLVGVHIRRRDYVRYQGGRYFYSHAQYRAVMEQVEAAFPDRDVRFLVCSDEYVPTSVFAGLDVALGTGEPLEDLYSLASCDRLLGPPSTYATWASYYGEVPRYFLKDPTRPVEPGFFRVDRRMDPGGPDTSSEYLPFRGGQSPEAGGADVASASLGDSSTS